MLLLISDLHISDERTAKNVNPEALKLLFSNVVETFGRRGAKEVHLVLLGDIFDLVRTDYWHRKSIPMQNRPWGGALDSRTAMNPQTSLVERQFSEILRDILVTDLAVELRNQLATLAGRVPLHVTYVPGNHERVLWNFPELRRQITAAIPEIATFARVLESAEYGVLARHGHEWDDNCHGWRLMREVLGGGRDVDRFASEVYEVMAIGEVVTAELMGGLIHHARALGAPAPLVEQLKEVNNLRPTLDVFAWLEWLGSAESKADSQTLHHALAEALDGLLASDLARLWDRITPDILLTGDLVDRLQQAKAVLLGPDFDSFKGRVTALKKLQRLFPFLAPEDDQLVKGAGREAVFADAQAARGIQRVAYGHTHRARHDYFAGDQDGRVKMYINTGTYLPLIARALDGRSFVSTMQMSIVYLYREDEDTERKAEKTSSVDIWTGIRRKQYA